MNTMRGGKWRSWMKSINPLKIISRLPVGRRTLWKLFIHVVPASMKTVILDVDEIKMHLDLTQNLDLQYASGQYDKEEIEFLLNAYEEGSCFLDIGANQGLFSLYIAKRIPNAKILAFEPDLYNLEKFEKNILSNGFNNITLCRYALSDGDEPKDLMINTGNNRGGSSMVLSQTQWTNKEETKLKVTCKTLLEAVFDNNVSTISALKIDIEGYEYPVLRKFFADAPKALYPKAVVLEAFGYTIKLVGGSSIELLLNNGYRLTNHSCYNYFFERRES